MNRVLKVALICGVAATMASCGTVRRNLPFGLGGGKEDAGATASAGAAIGSTKDRERRRTSGRCARRRSRRRAYGVGGQLGHDESGVFGEVVPAPARQGVGDEAVARLQRT